MKKCNCGPLDIIAFILVVIGGLNWGLVGLFNFNLVAAIFGDMSLVSRIVYILVGLAALYKLLNVKKYCNCKTGTPPSTPATPTMNQ
ncbi:MAG TPA: DUF378 domain-containing protein [Candidatus Komeilibacteria bacterium]|nr:MAG: hypothetical protein UW98_C0046G0009 [Parcubacteria group bacterium GW2011_GWC2_45_15]HBV02088.1 DUF378 domain-containing protein [Candidatus Komeilibacteria bacterium]